MVEHSYYYLTNDPVGLIRIRAKRRPSLSSRPARGTWVVRELQDGKWAMPCAPEITWGTLSKLEYIGWKQSGYREMRVALECAEQFILNGLELGYIQLPDRELDDSAHNTLPLIRAALGQEG